MEVTHIELEDGHIIKLDAIQDLDPRFRRITFLNGLNHNLCPEDVEKLKKALLGAKPKTPKRVPSKRVATKKE